MQALLAPVAQQPVGWLAVQVFANQQFHPDRDTELAARDESRRRRRADDAGNAAAAATRPEPWPADAAPVSADFDFEHLVRVHARHQGQRQAAGRAGRIGQPDGLDALRQSRRQTPAVTGPTCLLVAPATFNGRAGCRTEHARLLAAAAEHALSQVTHLAIEMLDFCDQRRLTLGRLGQLVAMAQRDPAFAFDSAFMLPAPVLDARSKINLLGVGDGDRRVGSGARVSRRRRPRLQRLDALI